MGGHELLAVAQLARDIPGRIIGDERRRQQHRSAAAEPGGRPPWSPGPRCRRRVARTRSSSPSATGRSWRWRASGPAPGRTGFAGTSHDLRVARGRVRPASRKWPTFAAKQWRHWQIGGQALPRAGPGVIVPSGHAEPDQGANRDSVVYEWDGAQVVANSSRSPRRWAYNWHAFTAGGEYFVAHAEHAGPSVLYRWDGTRLASASDPGRRVRPRVRHLRRRRDKSYLVVACIAAPTRLLRWDGARVRGSAGARRPGRGGNWR